MPLKTRGRTASRTRQLVTIDDMTGGVDLRLSPTLLGPTRARTLRNWSLAQPGALPVRKGYVQVSTASLGAGRAQGGQRVYLASTVFSLVAWSGAIYRPTDAWVWGSSVNNSSFSTANEIHFPYDRDLVMVMDGANRPRFSTNGSTWMLTGITAPSSAATLSSASSGGLSSGEYAIAYTYKHRGTGFESNGSSESTITVSASTTAIHATASPSTDVKVDAYVWYARHKTPDGESILRKVSSGAASTVTITSSAWTSNDEIPTNHDVPVAVQFAAIWKNRWWAPDATVGNRLRFTEIFLPQAWPTDYYIDIPFEKGDAITAVQPFGDTLLLYGQSGVYLIIGQTSLDFEVRPSQGTDAGAFGPRAVARVEQAAVHVSADGIDSFDGAADRSLEHDIRPAWDDLVSGATKAALARVAIVHDPRNTEVRISVPRVYPTAAAGEWVLNLARTAQQDGTPAWATTDRDIAFYLHWNGNEPTIGNRGRLFSMPSTAGIVFEESTGTTANSSNMVAVYEGPTLSVGLHRARIVEQHVEFSPTAGAFASETLVDGVSQGSLAINIGSGVSVYGTAVYGTGTYAGAGRLKSYAPLPLGANGRTMQNVATYTGKDAFEWFTYTYGILPEVTPRQFTE